MGLSWTVPTTVSGFINLRETESDRQQLVLIPHRPGNRKAEMGRMPSAPVKPGRYDAGHRHRREMPRPWL